MIPSTFIPKRNMTNDYLLDREIQQTTTYTGIWGVNDQDRAIQESMGPIYDRRKEHLGTSDQAIITARRRLLNLARELQQSSVVDELPNKGRKERFFSARWSVPI